MESREVYIEIPLNEYRKLVEECTEHRVMVHRLVEDEINARAELKTVSAELARITDLYEQVVVELESYKRAYDKEEE